MEPTQQVSRGGPSRIVLALAGTTILAVLLAIALFLAQSFGATAATERRGDGAEPATSSAGVPSSAGIAPAGGVGLSQSTSATQTNEGGQVTVKVTWQGREAGGAFRVVLDTHSVNLDGIDLKQTAVLRIDGAREARPLAWDAPKGGHHREGTLLFPDLADDGSPLLGADARTLDLVIRDVAGVKERVFRWQT